MRRIVGISRVPTQFVEAAVLLLVAVPLLFVGVNLSFLDPDEGLYADIARTMLESGDWVLPRFNGLPYLEKPPLYFWLASLTLTLDRSAAWPVRIWSPIAALGTVLLVWRIGRPLYGGSAGFFAGLALATTAGYGLFVRRASTDLVFVLCLTLSMYGFLRDVERSARGRSRFLLFYLGAALAVLAKGLIGVVFPVLIVGVSLVWVGRLSLRELNLVRGTALFGLVALPWHAAVAWRHPDLFRFYLLDNQLLRFLGLRAFVEDDVSVSTIGFLLVTFIWLFPWGVFVLARSGRDLSPGAPWRPVVAVWAVVVIAFFALARLKLEYYALPAFPALAVLVGGAWASGRDVGRWLFVGAIGAVVTGLGAVWLGGRLTTDQAFNGLAELNVYYRILRDQGTAFPFPSARPFGALLQALGVTLVLGWSVAALSWWLGWRRLSFATLVAHGAVIAILIVQVLQLVEPHHSVKGVSEAIRSLAARDDVVMHEGSLEYSASLPFYTGRRVIVVDGVRGDLDFASRLPEAQGYFVDVPGFQRVWGGPLRVFLVTRHPRERSAANTLPVESVHVLGRFGSRWLYSNRGA